MIVRVFFFCLLGFALQAQNVSLNNLSFENQFEEEKIREFEENHDYLAVLIASSGRGNDEILKKAEAQFEALYQSLNPEKLQKKSPKKKIKKIFKAVQNDLFIRYSLENQFIEVFENGRYNCVSATATYALLLNRFAINYRITQEPEHVYLTATFDDLSIVMEGTDPQGGYVPITDKLIEAQINSLLNRKLITEEELNSPDAGKILDELFPSKEINLEELIGVQYENKMVYNYESENYEKAYENALKALYFYDCERFKTGLYTATYAYLEELGFEDPNFAQVLGTLERLDTSQTHIDEINRLASFAMASLQLENKGIELSALYRKLKKELKNPKTLKNADLYHSLFLSELFYKKGRIDSSYYYSKRAMSLDSNNLHAPDLLIQALFKNWELNALENAPDTLDLFYLKYSAFRQNQVFINNFMTVVLVSALDEMDSRNYSKSYTLISRFEELVAKHPGINADKGLIAKVYGKMAIYEFNRNKNTALKTLNRGLKYAPGARDLVNMKAMILN